MCLTILTEAPVRKSWFTAASVLAAATVEGHLAEAQIFTSSPTSIDFGDVRIGTSSSGQAISATTQVGNLTSGQIGAAAAPFSGGPVNLSTKNNTTVSATYVFSPTGAGAASDLIGISAMAKNGNTQMATVPLSGTGVGPQYVSIPAAGTTIDFGNVAPGATAVEDLSISNASTDPGGPTLTDLTLLTADLKGAAGFALANFTPNTVLPEGSAFDLKIGFSSSTLGVETADLKITTDQGAALGQPSAIFDYTLTADVVATPVPEPASIGLLASGLAAAAGVGLRRRRPR
jgi:hypothetical protein